MSKPNDRRGSRLRYSLAALVMLVGISAVICSLVMPLARPKPGVDRIHSTFQVTAANRAQCASCHVMPNTLPLAGGPPALVPMPVPRPPAQEAPFDTAGLKRYFKQLARRPQAAPDICPGASAGASANQARCVSCHAVKL